MWKGGEIKTLTYDYQEAVKSMSATYNLSDLLLTLSLIHKMTRVVFDAFQGIQYFTFAGIG